MVKKVSDKNRIGLNTSLPANLSRFILILVVLSTIHLFLDNYWAWEVGWVVHQFSNLVLSFFLYKFIDIERAPIDKSIVLIYMVFSFIMMMVNLQSLVWHYFF